MRKNMHSRSVFEKNGELFVEKAVHFAAGCRFFRWFLEEFYPSKAAFGHVGGSPRNLFGTVGAWDVFLLAEMGL